MPGHTPTSKYSGYPPGIVAKSMSYNHHNIGSETNYDSKNPLSHDDKSGLRVNERTSANSIEPHAMVQLKSPEGYLKNVKEPLLLRVVSLEMNSEPLVWEHQFPKYFAGETTSLAEEPWGFLFEKYKSNEPLLLRVCNEKFYMILRNHSRLNSNEK